MKINKIIKQIMPPPIPIEAVCYDEIDGKVWRDPILYFALWDDEDVSFVTPCVMGSYGEVYDAEETPGFLGYEYNNEHIDWNEHVKCYLKEKERSNG